MTLSRWAIGIVGVALLWRLLLLWVGSTEPRRFFHEPDSSGYEMLAVNLFARGRFSLERDPPFKPDHTRTPLYPALLGALYTLIGRQPVAAAFLGVMAGTATVAAIVFAGPRLAGPTPALVAGGILALDPASAGYSSLLLTEPFFTLFLTLGVLSVVAALRSASGYLVAGATVGLGLASLTRPIGVYLPVLPAVLLIGYAFAVAGPEVYPRFRVPLMPWVAWLAGLGLTPLGPGSRVYWASESCRVS